MYKVICHVNDSLFMNDEDCDNVCGFKCVCVKCVCVHTHPTDKNNVGLFLLRIMVKSITGQVLVAPNDDVPNYPGSI